MLRMRASRLSLCSSDTAGYPDSPLDSYGYDQKAESHENPSRNVRKVAFKNLDTDSAGENDRESGSTVGEKCPFVGKDGSVDRELIPKDKFVIRKSFIGVVSH